MRPPKLIVMIFLMSTIAHAEIFYIALTKGPVQRMISYITAELIYKLGHDIEFVETNNNEQWGALARGLIDIQIFTKQIHSSKEYSNLINKKLILDFGNYKLNHRQEWWVPKHVVKLCDGLPNWRSLRKCQEDKSLEGKTIYYYHELPFHEKIKLKALDIHMSPIEVSTVQELEILIKNAKINNQFLMAYVHNSGIIAKNYEGVYVDFPEFNEECYTDPTWGFNSFHLFDCANPKSSWIKKIASTKILKKSKCVSELIQKINFDEHELKKLIESAFRGDQPINKKALYWTKNNKNLWYDWYGNECEAII